MSKGMNFWKANHFRNKKQWIVITVILAVILFGIGGWYYFVYTPHKKHELEEKNKKIEFERQVKQVVDFYEDQLKGGSIKRLELLLNEIYRSRLALGLTGYIEQSFSCKTDSCTFSYAIAPLRVFNVQQKVFWGKDYSANFSNKGISFSGIPSKMAQNPVLKIYQDRKDIDFLDCSQMLSYIYAFNSINPKSDEITIVSPPSSSVIDVEEKIKGSKKYYGLLFGQWTFKAKDDLSHIMSLFERQAYKDSFIIKNIELKTKEVKVSGGFVCKSGK